jgi:hypothetical protein
MVGSTTSTTIVLVTVLVVAGSVMVGTTIWLVRATRRDTPALGPLEVMGERRWRRADGDHRTTALTEARPAGAPPPAPTVAFDDDTAAAPSPNGEPTVPEPVVPAHTSGEKAQEPATGASSEA